MKKQSPNTLSNAARRVLRALGHERVGEIVRRSPTLIYKWSDPDLAYYPNLQQALELDAAFMDAGHGAPPFLTAYAALLKLRTSKREAQAEVLPDAIKLVNLACEILGEISVQGQACSGARKAPKKCTICQNLRRLSEMQTALAWTLEHDPSEVTCPLKRSQASEVECSIGVLPK